MSITIVHQKLQWQVYGFGSTATNKDYTGTAFRLSGKMWEIVKTNGIKNKGRNIWVYENEDHVFTGVELEDGANGKRYGLEEKTIVLEKYAYLRHIGPYNTIAQAGEKMRAELTEKGYRLMAPYIEIYGHWTGDENKSETELYMSLK